MICDYMSMRHKVPQIQFKHALALEYLRYYLQHRQSVVACARNSFLFRCFFSHIWKKALFRTNQAVLLEVGDTTWDNNTRRTELFWRLSTFQTHYNRL